MHVNETITSGFKDYRLKYGSKMEIQKTTFQEVVIAKQKTPLSSVKRGLNNLFMASPLKRVP
jgi:hypothetical protein